MIIILAFVVCIVGGLMHQFDPNEKRAKLGTIAFAVGLGGVVLKVGMENISFLK